MTAIDLLRRLTKTVLPRQFLGTWTAKTCSTLAQPSLEKTEVNETEEAGREVYYKYKDYEHLLERKTINRKQLRAMIYRLNCELSRGRPGYPQNLNPEQIHELIQLPSWNKRRRFLKYHHGKEEREFRRQNPRKQIVYDAPMVEVWTSTDELPGYGLHRNSIFPWLHKAYFLKILETTMMRYMPFAQKVALDFSYDHLMTPRECNKLSIDIKGMHSANRWSTTPLNFYFCSFDPEKSCSASIIQRRHIDTRSVPFPYEVSPKSVVDLFPRESIVYLTPEGDEVLDKIDSDCVYVLGALVDKNTQTGASARRAQELGVSFMDSPKV